MCERTMLTLQTYWGNSAISHWSIDSEKLGCLLKVDTCHINFLKIYKIQKIHCAWNVVVALDSSYTNG